MKIGDYVRTKYGITQYREYEIDNCGLISELICMPVKNGDKGIFANVEDIIKSSPNIIDLIEVGDYVNGLRVNEISEHTIFLDDMRDFSKKDIDYIKSILTKEQFESMEYKVGEDNE